MAAPLIESLIKVTHPAHHSALHSWQICRDAYEGELAIKARNREDYLPRLGGQEGRDYENYIQRAVFYPVMSTVVNGRIGQVFNKPPKVEELPDSVAEWILQEVTKERTDFIGSVKSALREVMICGRVGILVDMPVDPVEGSIPYLCTYKAEDIKNWKKGSDEYLSMVTLCEYPIETGYTEDGEFKMYQTIQYRHLALNEEGEYIQQVFREEEGQVTLVEETMPTVAGVPLDYIPFTFINVSDITPNVDKPPLLDMATVNLAHYRNSADYEQVLHMLAVPTPYGTGIDDDEALQTLGPLEFKAIRSEGAKLGLLEFSGAGTDALRLSMDDKMAVMSAIGGALVQRQRSQVETAETARIRSASETSILETICGTLEQGMEQVLDHVAVWLQVGEETTPMKISINRDFINEQWAPDQIKAITEAELMGVISKETAFHQRQLLEFYPDGTSFDDEQERISMRPGNLPDEVIEEA